MVGFLPEGREGPLHFGCVRGSRTGRQQDCDRHGFRRPAAAGFQRSIDFVFKAIVTHPAHETELTNLPGPRAGKFCYEGIVRHVVQQFHSKVAQLFAPRGLDCVGELNQEEAGLGAVICRGSR